jgi:hypothetical protein
VPGRRDAYRSIAAQRSVSAERNYPFLAADSSLKAFGFVEEEFVIEGRASAYDVNLSRTHRAIVVQVGARGRVR